MQRCDTRAGHLLPLGWGTAQGHEAGKNRGPARRCASPGDGERRATARTAAEEGLARQQYNKSMARASAALQGAIAERLGLEGTSPTPCQGQGCQPPAQVAQGPGLSKHGAPCPARESPSAENTLKK